MSTSRGSWEFYPGTRLFRAVQDTWGSSSRCALHQISVSFSGPPPPLLCRHSQTICTYPSDGRKPRPLTPCILVHKLHSITAVKVCPDTRTFAPRVLRDYGQTPQWKPVSMLTSARLTLLTTREGQHHHLLPSHSTPLLTCGTKADTQLLRAGQVFDIVISQLLCANKMTHVGKTKGAYLEVFALRGKSHARIRKQPKMHKPLMDKPK